MAIVTPENIDEFMEICRKWEVSATIVGELTEGNCLVIDWHGETIVDVDPRTVAHEGPEYDRPQRRPEWMDMVIADDANALPRDNETIAEQVKALVASPNLCSKTWITNQYDRFVRGNTVLAQPENSGMIRIDENTGLGIAMATDANGRYSYLNPYWGAQLALSESYRNVAMTGATPVAITDCLNFGSPENPEVMWQFVETILGLVDACRELGIAVTGGNVSFYNNTDGVDIHPTPAIGTLGVIQNVADRIPMGFANAGDAIVLLGETKCELGGSAWTRVIHEHLGGTPPVPNLDAEQKLATLIREASEILVSAHDLSEGGIAIGLIEACWRNGFGAHVSLPHTGLDNVANMFSESPARAVVTVAADDVEKLHELCESIGVPMARIGTVAQGNKLSIDGICELDLDELREASEATIPEAMKGV